MLLTLRKSSPANSQSKKSECLGSRFIRSRNKIDSGLTNLEKSEVVHSEALLNSAKRLDSDLSKLNIEKIVTRCESDPDANEAYGGTIESIIDWEEKTKDRLDDLMQKADIQIMTKKSATTSGFEKRKYPSFSDDPLNYFVFKKCWKVEVEPEKQIKSRELFNLSDNIPLAAKNKMVDVDSLAVA